MTLDERVERAKRLLAEKQAQKAKEADEVSNFYFELLRCLCLSFDKVNKSLL